MAKSNFLTWISWTVKIDLIKFSKIDSGFYLYRDMNYQIFFMVIVFNESLFAKTCSIFIILLTILLFNWLFLLIFVVERISHRLIANVLDCNIVGSKFKLQSQSYVLFRTNTLAKGMNSFIHPRFGLKSHQCYTLARMALALNNPQKWICH